MMRFLIQRAALVLAGVVGLLGTRPATANAQKALVYCPVNVDATGCNAIVTALTGPAFPLGVDRGYDGTGGTVDLKAVDLFSYAVFVVPSLADGSASQPYAKLRDPEVVEHLKAALIGRIAMWSGTPDQGATNRAMKDALIQNLAGWAAAAYGTAKGPGLVTLLDASASAVTRYDWVRAIAPLAVTADANLLIYNSVRALNPRATAILTSGAGPIAYTNMATYGFQVPNGAAGVSLDAVGQTGTSVGGQVVLLTMEAGNSTGATVKTDKDDYAPGTTVAITGAGWEPGETVKLVLHHDPTRDADTELTATATSDGKISNTDFAPANYDIDVRFVLTAIGQISGRRAQTTFTDGNPQTLAIGTQSPNPVAAGSVASYTISLVVGGNTTACTISFAAAPTGSPAWPAAPPGGYFSFTPASPITITNADVSVALAVTTSAAMTSALPYQFVVTMTRGANCQGSGDLTATGTLSISPPAVVSTSLSLSAPLPASVSFASSGLVAFSTTLTRTTGGTAVTGAAVDFTVDGSSVGTATTDGSGVATLSTYNPSSLSVGPHTVQASSAAQTIGGTSYASSASGTQTLSVTKANQTITFGALADKTFGDAPFTVSATASSGLPVSFAASGNCSVSGTTVTITGAGSCTVTASQAGNGNYNAAANVPQTFSIAKANQTISFAALPNKNFGDAPFNVTATATSGLTVAFAVGGADNCTILGNQVTLTGAGSCTVTASQAGDANYNAAVSVPQSFTIGKANQTVTFDPLPNKTFGDTPFAVTATASSGLAVTFAVGVTDNCTIAVNTVTITGAGTCTVTASQAGNANYNAAADVPRTFTIDKAAATVTIDAATLSQTYTGAPRIVTATTNPAGLTVVGITYDGSATPPTNAGSYAIVATLTNANYAAPNATGTLNVAKATQTITFGPLGDKTFGDAPFSVSATTTSGLTVAFTATGNCSVVGTQVTITGAGSCEITANQAGDTNYDAAVAVSQSFAIAKFTPTVIATGGTFTYDGLPKPATATVTGVGGALLNSPATTFTYNGSATEPVNAGTYAVIASYAGNANYNTATGTASIKIDPATPTITWTNPADIVYGTLLGATQLNATATGVGGAAVAGSFTYDPPAGTLLGAGANQTLKTDFASTDPNYTNVLGTTVTITVLKFTPTLVATGLSTTYNAQPHPATATITGINGTLLTVPAATFTYAKQPGGVPTATVPVNAGEYAVVASYAGDVNYNPASSTNAAVVVIAKATPAFSNLASPSIVYGTPSQALGGKVAAGSLYPTGDVSITLNGVTQQGSIAAATGLFSTSFTTNLLGVSGSPYPIAYSYAGDENFNAVSPNGAGTLTVTKAPLEIAFTPLSATFGVSADFPPAFTITPTGFVNSETVAVLGGTLAFSPAASTFNASTFAGATMITPSGYTSANYAITFKPGTFTIVDESKPIVTNTLANPVPINVAGTVTANVSDETTGHSNIKSAEYSIDGGTWVAMAGSFNTTFKIDVTGTLPKFTDTGVHVLCVRGTDAANNTSVPECVLLAVYDPNAGFVTGGGWINSPVNACQLNEACKLLSGKANFGFVSKYKKGATTPDGNTEFQFHAGGVNFKSGVYEWLVVAGARAQFKGTGTINGSGNYGFLLSAVDGQINGGGNIDKFRIKIWDKNNGDAIVYDNEIAADETAMPTTTIAGGSINIQAK